MSDLLSRNEAIARRLWRAAAEGVPDPILEFDPKVVWRTYGQGPNAGEFIGIDEVLRYLEVYGERAEALRLEMVDVTVSPRSAVIEYRVQASRGPKELENRAFMKLGIEDGVVTDVVIVPFDQAKGAAFWRVN